MLTPLTRRTPWLLTAILAAGDAPADDPIRDLQNAYVANRAEKAPRAYHFGSQGPGDVFSNHAGHTNRLIPVEGKRPPRHGSCGSET